MKALILIFPLFVFATGHPDFSKLNKTYQEMDSVALQAKIALKTASNEIEINHLKREVKYLSKVLNLLIKKSQIELTEEEVNSLNE